MRETNSTSSVEQKPGQDLALENSKDVLELATAVDRKARETVPPRLRRVLLALTVSVAGLFAGCASTDRQSSLASEAIADSIAQDAEEYKKALKKAGLDDETIASLTEQQEGTDEDLPKAVQAMDVEMQRLFRMLDENRRLQERIEAEERQYASQSPNEEDDSFGPGNPEYDRFIEALLSPAE